MVVEVDIVVAKQTVPAEVKATGIDCDALDGVGKLDHLADHGIRDRLFQWNRGEELDGATRHGVVLGGHGSPGPVDRVRHVRVYVQVVVLADELPVWNTDAGKELPEARDLRAQAGIAEADVVEAVIWFREGMRRRAKSS